MFTALIILLSADALLLLALLIQQQQNQHTLMADINQVLADLRALKTSTSKIFGEVSSSLTALTAKITELEERLANQQVPEEVATLIAEIKTGLQQTDDLIPDAPTPEPPQA